MKRRARAPTLAWPALTAALAVAMAGGSANAQAVDTAFFNGGQMLQVQLYTDSMGIAPRAPTTQGQLEAALPADWQLDRRTPEGLWVARRAAPLTLPDVFSAAGTLEAQNPELITQAGPLGRIDGMDGPVALSDQFMARFHDNVSSTQIDSINSEHQVEILEQNMFMTDLYLLRVMSLDPTVIEVANAYHSSPLTQWAMPDVMGGAREDGPAPGPVRPSDSEPGTRPESTGVAEGVGAPLRTDRVPTTRPAGSRSPATSLTTDPFYPQQWHLENTGQNGGTSGDDINVNAAWSKTAGSSSIVVALIENGGFDLTHPDLDDNYWHNPGELGADEDGNGFVNDLHGWDFSTCPIPTDTVGMSFTILQMCGDASLGDGQLYHGTAVAGIVAAETNNGIGVAGICQTCQLMLIRSGSSWYSKTQSFLYARDEGADVINASWSMTWIRPISDAITSAANTGRGGKGSLVVFSMANRTDANECTGPNKTFASMSEVTSVSATNNHDVRVDSAGWGDCLDLMAPGATGSTYWGVTTTDVQAQPGYNVDQRAASCPLSALSDLAYTVCSGGTSMSAPMVSGVAALVLSVNSTLTRSQLHEVLVHTADKVNCPPVVYVPSCTPHDTASYNDKYGYGRVNAGKAVEFATDVFGDSPPPTTPPPAVPATFEMGFRMGATWRTGGASDKTTVNAPGGGPAGEPAFYVAWISSGAASWMVEAQLGVSSISVTSPASDEDNLVAALQPTYLINLGGGEIYTGVNVAVQDFDSSASGSFTSWGGGVAVGYRFRPVPQLALRFESRYRQWSAGQPDEFGLAFGLGVVIP